MKIKIDSFLKAENLNGATSKSPVEAIIDSVKLIPAAELGFPSETDKYELTVLLEEGAFQWLANNTSLKAFIAAFGDETETWNGKTIKLYSVEQNVGGKIKQVVYGVV